MLSRLPEPYLSRAKVLIYLAGNSLLGSAG